jgi:hypothetical protein
MSSFIGYRARARNVGTVTLALLGANFSVASVFADDAVGAWQFRATAYGYFPDTGGRTALPGATDIDISARDVLDHTDTALMTAYEARKGRFGAFTDVIAIDLSSSVSGLREIGLGGGLALPPGVTVDASTDVKMRAATFAGEFRAYDVSHARLDVFAGARKLELKGDFGYELSADFGPFAGLARKGALNAKLENWDAVVGAKGSVDLGREGLWLVRSYADIGGGDSARTWQGLIVAGRAVGRFEIAGGWRHVDYRFRSSSRIESLTFDGPIVGATFAW